MSGTTFHVVTFSDEGFEELIPYGTKAEAQAFAAGYGTGAGHYGAGWAVALVIPGEEAELEEIGDTDDDSIYTAVAEAKKALKDVGIVLY